MIAAPHPAVLAQLDGEASAAADRAGVTVRNLGADEMAAAARLYAEVWRTDGQAPMEVGLLVALGHAGNYCSGAYAGGELVGACTAFFGTPLGEVLHSHIAGVRPGAAGPGVGTALKLHQRAWAARLGVSVVAWTYDPLIARNAWFNLERLGAHVVDYLVDFYGDMDDGLNAGQGSDRLLVHWPVVPTPRAGTADAITGSYAALEVGADDEPVRRPLAPGVSAAVLGVPTDVEALRVRDLGLGARWRVAFRETYADLAARGWRIAGVDRHGRYTMTPERDRQPEGHA